MAAPALSITGLRKVYEGGTEALKAVDLEVERGDFHSLLGPNGAGKTTLIGIVTGLVNKTSGTVKVFDTDIENDHDRAKSFIGLVPQEMNFNIFETPQSIVCTQGGYYGLSRRLAQERAEKYLTALGLWEKRNAQARTLSGGMKRRLMLARALVHEPELLILDEPTAGVDVELRRGLWDFLRTLTAAGKTIILTTHYLEEAEELARHVAIMNKGEVVMRGAVKELINQMDTTTFVVDLAQPLDEHVLVSLSSFAPFVRDPETLELTATREHTLGSVLTTLASHGVTVMSVRPKGNRLEELFVRLTTEHP